MTDRPSFTWPEEAAKEIATLKDDYKAVCAERDRLKAALKYIADTDNTGRWSFIPIDTEAANGWACCVDEMQKTATVALHGDPS